jgi:hypothetical protein
VRKGYDLTILSSGATKMSEPTAVQRLPRLERRRVAKYNGNNTALLPPRQNPPRHQVRSRNIPPHAPAGQLSHRFSWNRGNHALLR